MTQLQIALAYAGQAPVHFSNILEILRRGSGEVKYASADGLLIYDRHSAAHFMSAKSQEAADQIFALIPKDCELLAGYDSFYFLAAVKRLNLGEAQFCHSALYQKKTPLPFPGGDVDLRPLEQDQAPYVLAHYSHSPGSLGYIEAAIERGMVGAYVDGTLAGFVGFHSEGSIGLLEVLPNYRRLGLGVALEIAAVNLALERGAYPFAQVIVGNEPSHALQRRLGLDISKQLMFWLFRD